MGLWRKARTLVAQGLDLGSLLLVRAAMYVTPPPESGEAGDEEHNSTDDPSVPAVQVPPEAEDMRAAERESPIAEPRWRRNPW